MHSSRMRTVRCSGRLGVADLPSGVAVSAQVRCVSAQGRECLARGVFAQGVCVSARVGVCLGGVHLPSPMNRMTDRQV